MRVRVLAALQSGPEEDRDEEAPSQPEQIVRKLPGDGAVGRLGGPLSDHDLVSDEALAATASSGPSSALLVRRHVVSSRRNAPRPWTNSDW